MTEIIDKKPVTLAEAAEANLTTGVLLLCKEALVTAIADRRLHRGHLCVLASMTVFMNTTTAKAWPGRDAIAAWTGMPVKTVSNLLLELRNFGYLIAERQAVQEANNRNLMVYTFGNIDHDTIRKIITDMVYAMRQGRAPEVPSQRDYKSRPSGTDSPVPAGLEGSEVPPQRVEKSRPSGDSNSIKELNERIWSEPSSDDADTPKIKISYAADFEAFWKAYPDTRNNSKAEAFKQWKALPKPDRETAMASMAAFAKYCREAKDYRCIHAERYLNCLLYTSDAADE